MFIFYLYFIDLYSDVVSMGFTVRDGLAVRWMVLARFFMIRDKLAEMQTFNPFSVSLFVDNRTLP